MKEITSKRKGVLTEEEIKLWFLKKGFSVSVPIGDDDRYDFIVDFNGKLVRMQSKTSNTKRTPGCICFSSSSIKYNSTGSHRTKYTEKDIDYFCTMSDETGTVYIVPVGICGGQCSLRITPAKNRNKKIIKFAEDFEGDKMIEKIVNG